MSTLTARRSAKMLVITLTLTLCSMVLPMQAIPARAQVDGNTYTSPTFGYTVTWDGSWAVVDERTGEVDLLMLSNGFSLGQFIGLTDYGDDALFATTLYAVTAGMDPAVIQRCNPGRGRGHPGQWRRPESRLYHDFLSLHRREWGIPTTDELRPGAYARRRPVRPAFHWHGAIRRLSGGDDRVSATPR